ncbi:hypothetical protein, partial [uncultured Campylobacter sp.]
SAEGAKDALQDAKGASQGAEKVAGASRGAESAQREDASYFEGDDSADGGRSSFEVQERRQDEAKFKPAPPLNIEEMGIPKINEANRLDDDDAPLDL